MNKPLNVYVIGDTQVRAGDRNPLIPVGWDIINTSPDVVVHLGDHHDFPSLSNYDLGKHSFDDRCYVRDVEAGNDAFREFWAIMQQGFNRNPKWNPKFVFLEGNHENRRHKAKDTGPRGYLQLLDLYRPDYNNWNVVSPFLQPYIINGVAFIHYVPNEFSDRPIGSAKLALSKRHTSFVAGHKQILDQDEQQKLDGGKIMGLIMGACYFHDEEYRGPTNQGHFRGIAYLRNLINGTWEAEYRNLESLDKKYGKPNG